MKRKKLLAQPIPIGISSCLLGAKVRFDAGHKRDYYITDILGQYFSFVPVCPELEVGMGVPRESVRLIGSPDNPQMVGNKTGEDWTDRMNQYSRERVNRRDLQGLSGYLLKKGSPSCGMERVKVYSGKGAPSKQAVGLFARALIERNPLLPVEEEGRLNDSRLRENFIVRVFAYHSLQELFKGKFSRGKVVEFHAGNKYLILAHSPAHYKQLGQLTAAISKLPPADFQYKYMNMFMEALKVKTTAKKNVNVLHHILGFLKKHLDSEDKKYLLEVIDDYRQELVPLIVPITLLKNYLHKCDIQYILGQTYLNPHPKELMLRNHV